jgi:phosphatidylserine decarboxylase
MTIHKEGYKSIAIATLVFVLLNLLSFFFISASAPVVSWIIFVVLLGSPTGT